MCVLIKLFHTLVSQCCRCVGVLGNVACTRVVEGALGGLGSVVDGIGGVPVPETAHYMTYPQNTGFGIINI